VGKSFIHEAETTQNTVAVSAMPAEQPTQAGRSTGISATVSTGEKTTKIEVKPDANAPITITPEVEEK
jgi:hypothetical protein